MIKVFRMKRTFAVLVTRIFPLILSLTILNGCMGNKPKANEYSNTQSNADIPEWVKTPPGDSSVSMYGIGEGYNLESAKQSALKDIAGKLATNVKSESENRDYLYNGMGSSAFQQKVNTQVKDTKLTNYEVLKTTQSQGQYYALIAMSRAAFVKDKLDQLTEVNSKIETELHQVKQKNNLLQLVSYNNAIQLANQARPLIYLIHAADSQQNKQADLKAYRGYEQAEKRLSETTKFFLSSEPSLAPLVHQIKRVLQTNGFQVGSKASADSLLEIRGSIEEADIFSTKSVKINFDVLVKTNTGQLVSSKSYQLTGSSVSTFKAARQSAMNKLTSKLKDKAGVYEMLGLST